MKREGEPTAAADYLLMILLAGLLAGVVITYTQLRTIAEEDRWSWHTRAVLGQVEEARGLLAAAESGQRGYRLTGDPAELRSFHEAADRLRLLLDELTAHTRDNPIQAERLRALRGVVRARLDGLARGATDAGGAAAGEGGRLRAEGWELVQAVRAEERSLLELHKGRVTAAVRYTLLAFSAATLTAMILLAMVVSAQRRRNVERDLAAEELSRERSWLATTLSSIGDGVIATDAAGRVRLMNPVAEALTGWSQGEAQGRPFVDVFRALDEGTRAPIDDPVARVIREKAAVDLTGAVVLCSRDGTEVPIDDSAAPIRDEQGRIVGVVLVCRDVTARRRADEALRDSETRFRLVARAINEGIWDCDLVAGTYWWNDAYAALVAPRTGEARGSWDWWLDQIHPEDRGRVTTSFREALEGRGETWSAEYRIRATGGGYAFVSDRAFIARDASGRATRFLGAMLDLTERTQLEDELRQQAERLAAADRQKDEFLATLAHELRNPLAPIRNAVDLLRHAGGDPKEQEDARATIERQLRQMVRLVDDLLDIGRVSRNVLELRRECVVLADVLRGAVESSGPLIESRGHTLSVSLPPEDLVLDADPVRLSQVFANLLNNAAKYTPPGGRIALRARVEDDEAVVRVRDTGRGIPRAMLPHVFGMFVQVDPGAEHSRGGLGIGLTLASRLVTLHGGRIEAESEGPGLGSEFIVRLPLAPAGSRPTPSADPGDAHGAPEAVPRRVLVVDDNHDAADTLARLLRRHGCDVRTAYDGPSALADAREFRPECVVLDISLPGLSGYDVARTLRGEPWCAETVLVAVTGWGQDSDRLRSDEAGFDHHLVKPVETDHLLSVLSTRARGPA